MDVLIIEGGLEMSGPPQSPKNPDPNTFNMTFGSVWVKKNFLDNFFYET